LNAGFLERRYTARDDAIQGQAREPEEDQAQGQRAKAADTRWLYAIDVNAYAAVGKARDERWIGRNISQRRDAFETFAVAPFEGQGVGVYEDALD
jgi:hypothetical protein